VGVNNMKSKTSMLLFLLMEIFVVLLMIYTVNKTYKLILILLLCVFEFVILLDLIKLEKWAFTEFFLFISFLIISVFILAFVLISDFYFISLIGLGVMSLNFLGIILVLVNNSDPKPRLSIIPIEELDNQTEDENSSESQVVNGKKIFQNVQTYDVPEPKNSVDTETVQELTKEAKALQKAQKDLNMLLKDAKKKETKGKLSRRKK
jgi:hypothetical protein